MSKKLTVKSGKGELTLRKSKSLVGLKYAESNTRSIEKPKAKHVKKEVHQHLGGFKLVEVDRKGLKSVDKKLDEMREEREVEIGTHVYFAEGSTRPLVPTGEIYILFEEGVSEEEQNLVLDEFKLALVERRSDNRIVVRVTKDSPNPIKAAHFIQRTSLVKTAEPDLDTPVDEYAFVEPQDDLLKHQWHLQNKGYVADANRNLKKGADAKVVDAWKRLDSMGDNGVVIAVIDNGFDLTHPDLKDKVYKPYDLWTRSEELVQGDPSFTHGTPCASVAIAASNGQGIVGAAPNAKFMPVSGTSFSLRATEEMFEYVVNKGADIVSCSWGTTDSFFSLSPLKEEAIAKAAREGRNGKGCVIIYAVGNEDQDYVSYYAAHPDVIAVAACTSQDQHASYSNRGREVSVCAPSNGDWPITAGRAWWDEGVPWESGDYRFWRDGLSRGERYKHFGGTSSACPLVAGICALILSANPDLTAKEVKEILEKTADKIGAPSEYVNGHSTKFGYGRVNADKAVAEALRRKDGVLSSNNGTTPSTGSSTSSGSSSGVGTTGTTTGSTGSTGSVFESNPELEPNVTSGHGLYLFTVDKQYPKGYGVQIGAFSEYGNVLVRAERFKREFGEPVVVQISEIGGRTVYKMVIGTFDTFRQAQTLQSTMREMGVRGFVRNLAELG